MRRCISVGFASVFWLLGVCSVCRADVGSAPPGRIYAYTDSGALVVFDSVTLAQVSGIPPTVHPTADLTVDETGRLFGEWQAGGTTHLVQYDPLTFGILNERTFPSGIRSLAARGGVIYSYTGMGSMVTFDAVTLAQLTGPTPTSHGSQDLAFDEAGRLFGTYQVGATMHLLEYNPLTLGVINSTSFPAGLSGLAVRDGTIYTYSAAGTLLTYDSDTLAQLTGPAPTAHPGADLAFDQAGRLFGTYQLSGTGYLVQIDPISLDVINATTFPPGLSGLAAHVIPEPSGAVLGMLFLVVARRTGR